MKLEVRKEMLYMTGKNNAWYAIRSLRTPDLKSGEELLIVYHPKADVVTINGSSVTRIPGLTGRAGQSVFHQAPGDREYIVATDVIARLYT